MGYGRLGGSALGGTTTVVSGVSPELRLEKTDAGTATLVFYSDGEARGQIQLDANENTLIQPPAGSAAATGATMAVRGGLPGGGEGIGGALDLRGGNAATATATARAGGNVNVIPGTAASGGSEGMTRLLSAVSLTSAISPSALAAGDTANYNPTGLGAATVLRLTPDAGGTSALSGIIPTAGGSVGAGGRLLVIANIGAAALQLTHDATSTAANRFICPNGANLAIPPNGTRMAIYDATSSRWRVVGAVA